MLHRSKQTAYYAAQKQAHSVLNARVDGCAMCVCAVAGSPEQKEEQMKELRQKVSYDCYMPYMIKPAKTKGDRVIEPAEYVYYKLITKAEYNKLFAEQRAGEAIAQSIAVLRNVGATKWAHLGGKGNTTS